MTNMNYLEILEEVVILPEHDNFGYNDVEQAVEADTEDNHGWHEESEPLVQDPSTDIRGDMEDILDEHSGFKGSFSFNKTYTNPPNPSLRVDDLGIIGLPLSTSQAKEIISRSIQAPFGKGERTIVDTAVRDTWEIDASKLHFDNPAWSHFMNGVTQEVCQTLGVKFSASQLRCEPYKLLLYETGSHFLPHQDTEKSKGMFATVIVVLPSLFTGGAAHLSHGGLSTILDCSAGSLYKTSILAWYTDVTHEIKPITSGYRLAIAYNLIHTCVDLKPVLFDNSIAVNQLRHVLLSWIQEASPMPAKLVYLLQHRYSHASFSRSALKGADAHKAAFLDAVAKPLGFTSDSPTLNVIGDDDCGIDDYWGGDVEMAEVGGRTVTLEHLVDLHDGHEIRKKMCFNDFDCDDDDEDEDSEDDEESEERKDEGRNKNNEFIPWDLLEIVELGPTAEREYEGYQGNGAGSLDLYYRRSVLVIWPHSRNPDIEYGDDPLKAASFIASTKSVKPTEEECAVTELLLRVSQKQQSGDQVLPSICEAACKWRDLHIWLKAVDLYGGTKTVECMTEAGIFAAIDIFGFQNIRPTIERTLTSEPSNAHRIDFINVIAGKELADPWWISSQRLAVMRSLKVPLEGEEKLLLDLTREAGGIAIFKEFVLHQLVAVASSSFSISLASSLHAEKKNLGQQDVYTVTNIVTVLLSSAIAKANFMDQARKRGAARSIYHYHTANAQDLTPDLPFAYIKSCELTENLQLIDAIIDKITDVSGLSSEIVQSYTKCVLMPLILLMGGRNHVEYQRSMPGLVKLCQKAVNIYMTQVPPITPTAQELLDIMDAIQICEGWDMVHSLVVPTIKAIHGDEFLVTALIQKLIACGPQLKFRENSHILLAGITTDLVDNLITGATEYSIKGPAVIIRLLNLCFDTHNAPVAAKLCAQIISRYVSSDYVSSDDVDTVLIPSLPDIQAILTRNDISPTTEPFRTLYKNTLASFVWHFVKAKPSDMIKFSGISCTCQVCKDAVAFLLQPEDAKMTLPLKLHRIGAPKRRHLEDMLYRSGASEIASWTMISTSPQGLSITRLLPEDRPQQKWWTNRRRAISTFDAITKDDSVRAAIIGSGYSRFINRLNGTDTREPVALSDNLAWGINIEGLSSLNKNQPASGIVGTNNCTVINAQASLSSSRPAADQRSRGQPPTKKLRYY